MAEPIPPRQSELDQEPATARLPQDKIAIFAASAALKIELEAPYGKPPGIAVDAASKVGSGYDWENKIRIKLAQEEILHLAAVTRRLLPAAKFSGHGAAHNKSLEAINQGQTLLIRVFDPAAATLQDGKQSGGLKLVPVTCEKTAFLTALCYRCLSMAMGVDPMTVASITSDFATRATQPTARPT
ncbi:MAG: hypothetical protein E6Q76_07315, partial [Rhizobium sp.]